MAIPTPVYIDENALHQPPVIRNMAYNAVVGQEGVIGNTHLAIKALDTPGAKVQAMPGAYAVLAQHLGGEYEGYSGKFSVAEQSPTISATTSSGGRTDLVILVVKNPYVSGAGSWEEPSDPANGQYAFIDVIEGVPANTNSVRGTDGASWSAITLARIVRGANTNVVTQDDIDDLRSLAHLGGTRTVIIDSPPADPPPIAQASYVRFNESAKDSSYPSSDTVHDYLVADTTTKNWPAVASFQVAVPDWAVECDAEFQVFNAQNVTDDVYGELWLDFGGTSTNHLTYAIEHVVEAARHVVPYGDTFTVPSSLRGTIITVRTKFRSYFTATGQLDAKGGTVTKLALNFQRVPDPS